MSRKIILVKKWGMYPAGHVFENPSDATVKSLCYDHDFGKLVGDDYFLRQLRSEKRATAQLFAEAKQQKDDVWKKHLDKEKQTATLDDKEDFSDIVETLPVKEHKVTEKKAVTKSKKKKRAASKKRKKKSIPPWKKDVKKSK